jgi:hypothetical protein
MRTYLLILFSAILGAGIFGAGFDFGNYYQHQLDINEFDRIAGEAADLLNQCGEGWEACLNRCESIGEAF